jgi:hypothetical protein
MDDDDTRTDTAERPIFVLPATAAPSSASEPRPATATSEPARRRPTPAWIAWAVVGALLVVAAFVGARLALGPADQDTSATDAAPPAKAEGSQAPEPDRGEQRARPTPTGSSTPPALEDSVDLTSRAAASVPAAAAPNNDVTGDLVTFGGDNLLDRDSSTCWRTAGDATGETLTFTFESPVTVTAVGLVNGYAKTSVDGAGRAFDWYAGNRRVLRVEWLIEGNVFSQPLGETRQQQTMLVAPTSTTTVGLRLVAVTPPGLGPTGRDYTAISSVALGGFAP